MHAIAAIRDGLLVDLATADAEATARANVSAALPAGTTIIDASADFSRSWRIGDRIDLEPQPDGSVRLTRTPQVDTADEIAAAAAKAAERQAVAELKARFEAGTETQEDRIALLRFIARRVK